MPHFGLIDKKLGEADAALLRSRLHLRGARLRFERGMFAAGIAALYDALQHGMRWYVMEPGRRALSGLTQADRLDDGELFRVLVRGQVLTPDFDFDKFESLVEKSLEEDSFTFDAALVFVEVMDVMTQLHVAPFDEAELPGVESPVLGDFD